MASNSKNREGSGSLLFKQLCSGALAGTLADAAASSSSSSAGAYMYRGPVSALYTIATQEGWRTLYKGYGTVIQIAPAQALYMATYQTAKKTLPGGANNPAVHFAGGILATLVQSSVMVPLEVIRTRQMVQSKAAEGAYNGSWQTARTLYVHEGVGALYRGFLLAQLVWGPYNAMYLPLWEATKRGCTRLAGVPTVKELPVQWEAASAFSSAAFAAFMTNPMSSTTNYSGAWDAARSIWRHEGMGGFFKGATSRVLWVAPSGMIMFTTFDQLMKHFTK
eukprot:jgi/Mesen1/6655/ME000340S05817